MFSPLLQNVQYDPSPSHLLTFYGHLSNFFPLNPGCVKAHLSLCCGSRLIRKDLSRLAQSLWIAEKCEPKNLQRLIKETFSGLSHPIMNPHFVSKRERVRSSCKTILKNWFGGQLWVQSCWFHWDIHNKVYFTCSLKVNITSCIGVFRRRLPAKGCRWLWYWWYNPKS